LLSFGTIMPISGGPAMEFETKKQTRPSSVTAQLHGRNGPRCPSLSQKRISN
jgi:hypothetical protein